MDEHEARFIRLYQELHARVLAYALCRVDPDQAHEVTAEAFLVAWRRRDAVPPHALPWLLVVVSNIIADQRRKGHRRDALTAELARCIGQLDEAGADVIVVERITVLAALAKLSDKDREVLILAVWDGLSNRDAAKVYGCSTATFTMWLHRARRRLAKALDQVETDPQPDHPISEMVNPSRFAQIAAAQQAAEQI